MLSSSALPSDSPSPYVRPGIFAAIPPTCARGSMGSPREAEKIWCFLRGWIPTGNPACMSNSEDKLHIPLWWVSIQQWMLQKTVSSMWLLWHFVKEFCYLYPLTLICMVSASLPIFLNSPNLTPDLPPYSSKHTFHHSFGVSSIPCPPKMSRSSYIVKSVSEFCLSGHKSNLC